MVLSGSYQPQRTRGGYIGQFGTWQSALQAMDDTEIDPETKRLLLWSISETDMSNRGYFHWSLTPRVIISAVAESYS